MAGLSGKEKGRQVDQTLEECDEQITTTNKEKGVE